jgi:uncharacterized protein
MYNKNMRAGLLLKRKRGRILEIARKYGATSIRVFGSVARNEDDEKSDVDFLVELEPGRTLFDLGGLLMELRELLGREVDVVTVRGLKERMRERVLKEAVPV